jgi:DNA-damage-inducible protein D
MQIILLQPGEVLQGKDAANRTHRQVGAKVRQTIRELGGTMPEQLPVAESIKKIEAKQRQRLGQAEAHDGSGE